ncbi:MAG: VOC family protein [Candidatus Obscuribacterales bacterium]
MPTVDEQQKSELMGLTHQAIQADSPEGAQELYRKLVEMLFQICNKNQKEIAAELQNLSKALESLGKDEDAIEFKQRTCAVMLEISMEERRRNRPAPPVAVASPPAASAPATSTPAPTVPTTNGARSKIIGTPSQSMETHKHALPFARLVYLYMGTTDYEATLAYYRDVLMGEEVWTFERFGARVTAFMLSHGPLVLVSDHRTKASCQPVFEVDDLEDTARRLSQRGWKPVAGPFGTPNGEAYSFEDPSGNLLAIFEADPKSPDRSYFDPTGNDA